MRSTLLLLGAVGLFVTGYACSGSQFSSGSDSEEVTQDGGGNGSGGTTTVPDGSSADSDITETTECQGPEDCNDGDPCTVDLCGPDSLCMAGLPTCASNQQCCDGACGSCCDASECDDMIDCTVDECSGQACTHMPDDNLCPVNSYCSATQGCRPREICTPDDPVSGACDDSNSCTADRCDGAATLCFHDPCAEGTICCPGVGCAECCSDSQCEDGNPCTRNVCAGGACTESPLCGGGQQCCEAGGTASCGTCCSAQDCNDEVSCTVDSCAGGSCSHVPNSGLCANGQTCDPEEGCVTPDECSGPDQCPARDCMDANCNSGQCVYDPIECGAGLVCCGGSTCAECCSNSHCNDNVACTADTCVQGTCRFTPDNALCGSGTVGTTCDPVLGCVECRTEADCNDNDPCTTDACHNNGCLWAFKPCPLGQVCCGETGECAECCSSCDCSGLIGAGGFAGDLIPPAGGFGGIIPPDCGVCQQGTCYYGQGCGC